MSNRARKPRSRKKKKSARKMVWRVLLACLAALALSAATLTIALYCADYGDAFDNSAYASDAFSGERVLVLVPHEDDELAMAGATIRLYVDGGAEVYVAFASNGDFGSDPDVRVRESLRGLKLLGVPEENAIFLGYGDSWDFRTYLHLYHAPGDAVVSSAAGRTETFGAGGATDLHSFVYGEPAAYTRDNLLADLRTLLRMVKPDSIFCVDLDSHTDHCGLSWFFEEAMGALLHEDASYRPRVYKGYAYSVAWFGADDFYGDNVLPSLPPARETVNDMRYALDMPAYDWAERVRFPMPRETLSYTLRANLVWRALSAHRSQAARYRARNIVNGDTVFFERRTDSLLYEPGARLTASSGDPDALADFKLADTHNLMDGPIAFDAGIWRPDASDALKSVTVTLGSRATLGSVSLYDDCDPDCNILSGTLTFSDGTSERVGPLRPLGQETRVTFSEKRGITSFTFTVDSFEGEAPGLSEIAAYAPDAPQAPAFIKLALENADSQPFLYRYTARAGETQPLAVYAYPSSQEAYEMTVSPAGGDVLVSNGVLSVSERARPGKYLLTARLVNDPSVFDTVEIVVPNALARPWHKLLSLFERALDRLEYRIFVGA